MLRRVLPDPFIVALVATVIVAFLLPARGIGAEAIDILATIAITLLFFFHGAKLPREAITAAVGHWRLHVVILLTTFVMFPLLVLGLRAIAPALLPAPLWTGMLFLAALPATVQSAIAFTSIARGNVAAAIASSSASQMLGVFVTPLLVSLMIDVRGGGSPLAGIGAILLQILLPFLIGHLLRPWIGAWVDHHKALISVSDRGAVLLAVYGAFAAATIEGVWSRVPLTSLAILLALCASVLALALAFTDSVARLGRFERGDRIAILFCGTKKSLVQGVPMARVLFAGPEQGLVLLPILIFHQMQLMICAWIAARLARTAPDP